MKKGPKKSADSRGRFKGARGKFRGPKRPRRIFKKRPCRFCLEKKNIDYLDFQGLRRFVTERGKIVPSRVSGCCARHQRQLARAIKRARVISLLSAVSR